MKFHPRASLWSVAALALACQQEGVDPDSKNSAGGAGMPAGAGATAGAPGAGMGMGGGAGTDVAMGSGGTPALGGMAGTTGVSGGAPGGSGAGASAGAPMAGGAGMAGSPGGAPAGGMSGDAGGAGGAGTGGAGTGGAVSAGAGGTVSDAGMAGMTAAAGMAGSSAGCSDGCAQLSVPFTVWNSGQYFEIYLSGATDMSAAVISVKARRVAGKAGGMLIVVKDGSGQNYAYAQSAWNALSDMTTDFKTFTFDVAAPDATDQNNTFDPKAVAIVTVQLAAGDKWYLDPDKTMEDTTALVNPTVIQIDEISIAGTGTLPGPWTFTADASTLKATITDDGLNASPPYAVMGSTVTWIGP